MTKRNERFLAALLLSFVGWCFHQHLKGREAMNRKLSMEAVEEEFWEAMDSGEGLHEAANKTFREDSEWLRFRFSSSADHAESQESPSPEAPALSAG